MREPDADTSAPAGIAEDLEIAIADANRCNVVNALVEAVEAPGGDLVVDASRAEDDRGRSLVAEPVNFVEVPADLARRLGLVRDLLAGQSDLALEIERRDVRREGAAAIDEWSLIACDGRQTGAHVGDGRDRPATGFDHLELGDRVDDDWNVDRQLVDGEAAVLQYPLDIGHKPLVGIAAVRARTDIRND